MGRATKEIKRLPVDSMQTSVMELENNKRKPIHKWEVHMN